MDVRRATAADASELARLNEYVHRLHVEAEPTRYRDTVFEDVRARFEELLDSKDRAIFIATDSLSSMGYVVTHVIRHPGCIYTLPSNVLLVDQLAVAPEHRRRGVGKVLMERAQRYATEQGLDRVELDVRTHNRSAIEFYRSLGYEPAAYRMHIAT